MTDNLYLVPTLNYGVSGTIPVQTVAQYAAVNGHTTEQAPNGFYLVISSAFPVNNPMVFIDLTTGQNFIAFPTHRPK